MKLRLSIVAPERWKGTIVPVGRTPYLIGRAGGCQLRFKNSSIDLRHCAVVVRDHRVFVQSLAEHLPTLVNDEQLESEREVQDGDRVQLGDLIFAIQVVQTAVALETDSNPPVPAEAEGAEDEAAALLLAMDAQEASQAPRERHTLPEKSVPENQERTQNPDRPMTRKSHPDRDESADTGAVAGDMLNRLRKKAAAKAEAKLRAQVK
jgi:predicted component of type VI protein secretion system